jgi:hypothetical protein
MAAFAKIKTEHNVFHDPLTNYYQLHIKGKVKFPINSLRCNKSIL